MAIGLKNFSCQCEDVKIYKENIVIPLHKVIGIIGPAKSLLLKTLNGQIDYSGSIYYKGQRQSKKDTLLYAETGYVGNDFQYPDFIQTVEEYFCYLWQRTGKTLQTRDKKMKEALKIVGLTPEYFKRNITGLSFSEKKLVQLAGCMLLNPSIILLDNVLVGFDKLVQKRLAKLFKLLIEKYHKTVIIGTSDSDYIYQYTDYCIILTDEKVSQGETQKVFEDVSFLIKHNIDVPEIVCFTYLVREKKHIKLGYHKDVRDLMKDIYKHVDLKIKE